MSKTVTENMDDLKKNEISNMDTLVRNTINRLHKFIGKRIYNKSDVDDIVQTTYFEAFKNQHKFSGNSSQETWLFGIASNLIRNHFRKLFNKPEMVILDEVTFFKAEEIFNPDYVNEHEANFYKILEQINNLPPEMQSVIYCIMDSDKKYHEIAEQLGVPVGTVRSRLSRARSILKTRIEIELK